MQLEHEFRLGDCVTKGPKLDSDGKRTSPPRVEMKVSSRVTVGEAQQIIRFLALVPEESPLAIAIDVDGLPAWKGLGRLIGGREVVSVTTSEEERFEWKWKLAIDGESEVSSLLDLQRLRCEMSRADVEEAVVTLEPVQSAMDFEGGGEPAGLGFEGGGGKRKKRAARSGKR